MKCTLWTGFGLIKFIVKGKKMSTECIACTLIAGQKVDLNMKGNIHCINCSSTIDKPDVFMVTYLGFAIVDGGVKHQYKTVNALRCPECQNVTDIINSDCFDKLVKFESILVESGVDWYYLTNYPQLIAHD